MILDFLQIKNWRIGNWQTATDTLRSLSQFCRKCVVSHGHLC